MDKETKLKKQALFVKLNKIFDELGDNAINEITEDLDRIIDYYSEKEKSVNSDKLNTNTDFDKFENIVNELISVSEDLSYSTYYLKQIYDLPEKDNAKLQTILLDAILFRLSKK